MKCNLRLLFFPFMIFLVSTAWSQQGTKETRDFVGYELEDLKEQLSNQGGSPWLPFLQGENVLTGLYVLKAGTEDRQQPHDTDEVYYVVSGKSDFSAGDQKTTAQAGSILFVKAEIEHRFFNIEEDLVVVVFFDQ